MEKLLGIQIEIHLKNDNEKLSGIIFDIDDDCVYIQNQIEYYFAIPKDNIKYYMCKSFNREIAIPSVSEKGDHKSKNSISVYIDNVKITEIDVPISFNLATCNEQILKLIWSDINVQNGLRDKVQKTLEYDIGVAYITTISNETQASNTNNFELKFGNKTNDLEPCDMINIIGRKT